MKKNPKHQAIQQRLNDWANYRSNIAPSLGWGVHMLDFDADMPRGVQTRNDVYADPVAWEYERMVAEQKRAMTTDAAVRELRPRWMRRLVVARHKRWPDLSDSALARKVGLEQRHIGLYLRIAYESLDETIRGMETSRRAAA